MSCRTCGPLAWDFPQASMFQRSIPRGHGSCACCGKFYWLLVLACTCTRPRVSCLLNSYPVISSDQCFFWIVQPNIIYLSFTGDYRIYYRYIIICVHCLAFNLLHGPLPDPFVLCWGLGSTCRQGRCAGVRSLDTKVRQSGHHGMVGSTLAQWRLCQLDADSWAG